MSDNYRYYVEKTRRLDRPTGSPTLRCQLDELFLAVQRCERMWALEERIERTLGR